MVGLLFLALALSFHAAAQDDKIRLVQVISGISEPTDIQHAGDGTNRLFLVEQDGRIRIFKNGALLPQLFLDITSKTTGSGERGLLGLAFPPGYATKQRFYVNYTNLAGHTVIAMYQATGDTASAASETILLTINQPFDNHNGGQIRFGPDGYLYIGMGDGGAGGDPRGYAQNRNELLGKMLRIDVESQPGTVQIPPSNPFFNTPGTRGEIWALGLRNPWRFSFDRVTRDLWIADVGQDTWEEVSFQPGSSTGGENYGWNTMEGAHCFNRTTCNMQGLVLPVAEYSHAEGCSITGGFVYRGPSYPGLRGAYFYGDLCNGTIWEVRRVNNQWVNQRVLAPGRVITTFGEDEAGEIYVADAGSGNIYRIEGSRAAVITRDSIVNAASFVPGLTPGSAASAFPVGLLDDLDLVQADNTPLPTTLAGVSVTVNGTPAPLYAVVNRNGLEQINFQVPFNVAGLNSASVTIQRDNNVAGPVTVPVLAYQPAVYTTDGTHAIAVRLPDYALQPLQRGDYAFVYATGLGAVANTPANGSPAPSSPIAQTQSAVTATVGGMTAEVQFAGLAPGLVGVYQVNFRVPETSPTGTIELILTTMGVSSPPVLISVI